MAELTTVARPYAEAAFSLARERAALPVWSEMLKLMAAVMADPKMQQALDSPRLTAAAKESLFLSVCGEGVVPDGRKFVSVLLEADRIKLLPQIQELFEERKREVERVAKARIISAFPLSADEIAAMSAALERRFGRTVEASVEVDASLIGGARIIVGDQVIDGSVAGKLDAMAAKLVAA